MTPDLLNALFLDELKDLSSAENQLVKAIPKMAKAVSSPNLRSGFENHRLQTKHHVERQRRGSPWRPNSMCD